MNILIVTHHFLHGNGGGCFASRAYINAFAEMGNVTLLCPMKDGMEPEYIDNRVDIHLVRYDKPRIVKLFDLIIGHIHRYYGIVENILLDKEFDLVVFDASLPSFQQIDIAHRYGCKVIVIHHNYQVEYTRDNMHGFIGKLMTYWVEKCEREAVLKADVSLTLTEDDKQLLHNHYDVPHNRDIRVIGAFEYKNNVLIDLSRKIIDNKRLRFVITGSLSSVQTYESLRIWMGKYLPVLRKDFIDCSLTVAGKNPSKELKILCRDLEVDLIPSPLSMEEILLNADYYICPVDLGSGIKLRIMDGLKAGLPIITHDVSLRGYEMFQNRFVFGYHDEQTFVESLHNMLNVNYTPIDIQKEYSSVFSFKNGMNRLLDVLSDFLV